MPILPPEPFIFPENLLTTPWGLPAGGPCWWVLHTRPRAEKALVRKVLPQSLEFFLPLYKKEWRNRGRLFCSHVPLFASYLFLRGDDDGRRRALRPTWW